MKKTLADWLEKAQQEAHQYSEKGFWVVIEVDRQKFKAEVVAMFKKKEHCDVFCQNAPEYIAYEVLEPAYVVWCMVSPNTVKKLDQVFDSQASAIAYCADYQFDAPDPVLWIKYVGEEWNSSDPHFDNGNRTKAQMISDGDLVEF